MLKLAAFDDLCVNRFPTVESALAKVRLLITKALRERVFSMLPRLTPTSLAYAKGFAAIAPLHDNHLALLQYHYRAPNRTRTATQLAEGVGYENFNAINLQYGLLAARLGDAMECADADLSLLVEFTEPHTHNNEHWTLQMRPEVAEALENLGWV